jgi:diaminohydroxyphosphoribosylaminopyrimidine deaminase/5-amino-6-(5-phosphoribosylamino)uracil reductase
VSQHRTADEDAAMLLAARLAWTAAGRTSPNPPVGAVILDTSGRIIGDGFTQPHGLDHAVQLWPHRHGTDAMFFAALGRRS